MIVTTSSNGRGESKVYAEVSEIRATLPNSLANRLPEIKQKAAARDLVGEFALVSGDAGMLAFTGPKSQTVCVPDALFATITAVFGPQQSLRVVTPAPPGTALMFADTGNISEG